MKLNPRQITLRRLRRRLAGELMPIPSDGSLAIKTNPSDPPHFAGGNETSQGVVGCNNRSALQPAVDEPKAAAAQALSQAAAVGSHY
jgi:hypothetical protein